MDLDKHILPAAALAVLLLALFWPLDMKSAADDRCKDPINSCKNPEYIGSEGRCSCFSCADKSVVCTTNTSDRLQLFESEAARRKPRIDLDQFAPEVRERLLTLGVVREDWWRNPPPASANTNAGNVNTSNRNTNANAGNWNFNRNINADVNSMNRPPARDDE